MELFLFATVATGYINNINIDINIIKYCIDNIEEND
jgi:hypothetical protein